MSESVENYPAGEMYASLQELRRKVGTADRRLIDLLTADLEALEARARNAEEECSRLRAGQEDEACFRSIFEEAGIGIVLTDRDWRVVRSNPAFRRMLGYSAEELRGMRVADLTHPDDLDENSALFAGTVAGKKNGYRMEKRYLTKAGEIVLVRLTATVIRDDAGEVQYLIGMQEDITAQKRVEEALRESEERYRTIFTGSRAILLIVDPETGAIVDANPAACSFYGYSHDRITGMTVGDLNTLPAEEVSREMQRARRGERDQFVFRHRLANGEIRAVEVFSAPVVVGGRTLLYSILHDITRQRTLEAELRRTGERFKRIFNESPVGIQYFNTAGRLLHTNRACLTILGVPRRNGMHGYNIFKDPFIPELLKNRLRRGEGGHTTVSIDLGLAREQGLYATTKSGTRSVEIYTSPVIDRETDAIKGFLVQILDVTDRTVMEAIRQQAFDQIERNMEQFAILGDHIRHPLQVIQAHADLLENEETAERIREQVRRVNRYITELDAGWVESRKIREFLQRNELL